MLGGPALDLCVESGSACWLAIQVEVGPMPELFIRAGVRSAAAVEAPLLQEGEVTVEGLHRTKNPRRCG